MIDKLNAIEPHVWAVLFILVGAGLMAAGFVEDGKMLTLGGFALYQHPKTQG